MPKFQVGGIKIRERNQAQMPLRIVQANKINDAKFSDHDDKYASKVNNNKRKGTRKIIRAGSLVKKNVQPVSKGRNQNQNLGDDFSNSFIEGKSFVNGNNKKPIVVDKYSVREPLPVSTLNEPDTSNAPYNIRDLNKNSKMLDSQNKVMSSAYVGPYAIGGNDQSLTFKSNNKENDQLDKKNKQQQYVQELNEQIRLRDKIKNEEELKVIEKRGTIDKYRNEEFNVTPQWSSMHYDKSLKGSVVESERQEEQEQEPIEFSKNSNAANLSPSKSSGAYMERKGLGSAPKAVGSLIVGDAERPDPFGGNIPIRRKVIDRIDQELESRGSIFSGRDERSILAQKRNLQQQHMREELLRQIEEKKRREDDKKKKRIEEELEEESKIKIELNRLNSTDGNEATDEAGNVVRRNSEKVYNQNLIGSSRHLPELTNRQSEPVKNEPLVKADQAESIYNLGNSPSKLGATAAFALENEQENVSNKENEEGKIEF